MATSKNNLVAGFDPGGKGSFGWCVAAIDPKRVIRVIKPDRDVGVASSADEAFCMAFQVIEAHGGNLRAAGIDAPLTWARNGGQRKADEHISKRSKGSAQAVNSLRGACVVQGFLLAEKLSSEYHGILITETNPKPLLKCAPDAKKSYVDVQKRLVQNEVLNDTWDQDHVQDAFVSAWAAAKALRATDQSWKSRYGLDLYKCKDEVRIYRFPFLKEDKTVYWWPK